MPTPEKPVGVVDELGYLFCVPCWERMGRTVPTDQSAYPVPVYREPHAVDLCDSCSKNVNNIADK